MMRAPWPTDQSMPLRILNVVLSALAALREKACTARRRAPGAVPRIPRRAAMAPAIPVPWACGFSGAPPTALKRCADHAGQIGVRDIDFGVDHRDRDIGAPDHAVNVQHLELVENVLRGVALLNPRYRRAMPASGRRGPSVPASTRNSAARFCHLEWMAASARMMSAGVLPSVMLGTAPAVDPGLIARFCEASNVSPSWATRGLQLLHGDIAGDLQDHLVLDETVLVWRRDVDDAAPGGRVGPAVGLPAGSRR